MAMSDFLESTILDMVLNSVAYAEPASVYIALFTTLQNDAGTAGVEVSGGGYARQQVTAGFTISGTATRAGLTSEVSFPTATASWGTIVGIGIYDAVTGGNLLYHGSLTSSKTINLDERFILPAGDLGITQS